MNKPHFTPRRKKVHSPSVVGGQKLVRIDHRTEIMVDVSVPDDVARDRYIERVSRAIRGKYIPTTANYPVKQEFKEIPVGDIEELEALVESVAEQGEEVAEE